MGEIRKTHWMTVSEELFLGEFEDPKDFYKKYSEPTELYNELARRALGIKDVEPSSEESYNRMYKAYIADQTNNNRVQLEELIAEYKA